MKPSNLRRLVLVLFFLSGALGLIYQIVWVRMLTQLFGTTAEAVGIVLASFMSGLALGSWLLGRLADRSRNPLRLYALLEVVSQQRFQTPGDVWALIPEHLPQPFTTSDLADAMRKPRRLAQRAAYCLRKMGAITPVGKRGRSVLYARADGI